jgi:hypothetical protein
MNRNRINVMVGLFVAVAFVLAGCRETQPEAVSTKTVVIVGAWSCGLWATQEGMTKLYAKSWLGGYLSGFAMSSGKDFLKGTDNPSIELWMDNYCKANPLKDIGDGANELAAELIRQKNL